MWCQSNWVLIMWKLCNNPFDWWSDAFVLVRRNFRCAKCKYAANFVRTSRISAAHSGRLGFPFVDPFFFGLAKTYNIDYLCDISQKSTTCSQPKRYACALIYVVIQKGNFRKRIVSFVQIVCIYIKWLSTKRLRRFVHRWWMLFLSSQTK